MYETLKLLRFGSGSRTRQVVCLFIYRLWVLQTIVTAIVDDIITHIKALKSWSAFHWVREDR